MVASGRYLDLVCTTNLQQLLGPIQGLCLMKKEPTLITGSLGTLVMKKASAVSLVL